MKKIIICISVFMAVILAVSCIALKQRSSVPSAELYQRDILLDDNQAMNNNVVGPTIVTDQIEIFDLTNISMNVDTTQSTLSVLGDIATASTDISVANKTIAFDSCDDNNTYNSKYYALYHYIATNQTDSEIAGTNEILSVSDSDDLNYLFFLSALLNDHSEAVAYYDISYDPLTTNRLYIPALFVCFEYKELGYDTIYEYMNAALQEGKEDLLENAYLISFDSKTIVSMSQFAGTLSLTNLYDTIFNNNVSE